MNNQTLIVSYLMTHPNRLNSNFYIYEIAEVLTLTYGQAYVLRGSAAHANDLKSKSP